MDGDRLPDTVGVVIRPKAPERCRSFLVVVRPHHEGRPRTVWTATIALPFEPAVESPALLGLASIDRRPGLEIVALLHEGASTAFGAIFTVYHGSLERMTLPRRLFGNVFPYEGSVTHFNVIDCVRPGSGLALISDYYLGNRNRYVAERGLYRIDGTTFRHVWTRRRTFGSVRRLDAARFPEFAEPQPFPSCMAVRPR